MKRIKLFVSRNMIPLTLFALFLLYLSALIINWRPLTITVKGVWIPLKPIRPELLTNTTFVAEGEDGQLVVGDYTNLDYMMHKYKEREVFVETKTFTKSSGEKIPFRVILKTRPKQ